MRLPMLGVPLVGLMCLPLSGAPASAAATSPLLYTVTRWNTDDGLPAHSVNAIEQTPDGYLWLATTGGLVRFDGHRFAVVGPAAGVTSIRINTVYLDRGGSLWFSTPDARLFRGVGGRFVPAASGFTVGAMGEDAAGRLWAADNDRLARLEGDRWVFAKGSSLDVSMVEARIVRFQRSAPMAGLSMRSRHLVSGPGGLHVVRRVSGSFVVSDPAGRPRWRVPAEAAREPWLVDRDDRLWVWTGADFEAYVPGAADAVARVHLPEGVRPATVCADREGNLWVGTARNGLFRLSRSAIRVFGTGAASGAGQVFSVGEGGDGRIVMLDEVNRSFELRRGDAEPRPVGGSAFVFTDGRNTEWRLTDATISGTLGGVPRRYTSPIGALLPRLVAEDPAHRGVFWLGTRHAVVRFAPHEDPARPFGEVRSPLPHAVSLLVERSGALLVANDRGVLLRLRGGDVETYSPRDGLPDVLLRSLHEDADGTVWIGTYGGGLVRFRGGRFRSMTAADGLAESVVSVVLEDASENLWLGGNRTIQRLPRAEADAFLDGRQRRVYPVSYARGAGLVNPEGSGQPGLAARDGRLWFPTFAGAAALDPALAVSLEREPPTIHIDRVQADRSSRAPDGTVTVEPGERRIAIGFTAISLRAPNQVRCEYRLDGLDPDWVDAGGEQIATYTHLPPGAYVFRVRATRGGGVWSREDAVVRIRVLPFFHETRAFAMAWPLALLCLALGAYRYRTVWLRRRAAELHALVDLRTRELEAEKATVAGQAKQLSLLDRARSRFFANISHEFRTPLTLVQGPLDDLLAGEGGELQSPVRQKLEISARNARRLLRLVEQLLDLARAESGTLPLRARKTDLAAFSLAVARDFEAAAERKAIALRLDIPSRDVPIWLDPDLMEKVLVNLLGNALKFTPPGGQVTVSVEPEPAAGGPVLMRVSDTGPGIPPADLSRVFERFYRSDAQSAQAGTGIGLAVAKELLERHGATITAERAGDTGTTFTVRLQPGRAHFPDDDLASDEAGGLERMPPACEIDAEPATEAEAAPPRAGGRPRVLLVDDNADVRSYLRGQLARQYDVVVAADGVSGLHAVRQALPDVVISDVMMPGLDGFQLCRAVKQDPETDCIPVILLTARASQESRIEGLETGADAYLPKPFNVRELKTQVGNLLASRRRLAERFGRSALPRVPSLQPSTIPLTSEDDTFLERLRQAVESGMGDEAFGVEQLAASLGQSRATLYRRVEALLDRSPMDVVWQMRLDRAAQLLAARSGTVAEVAYAVGFSSLSHFSRRFKERHGRTPSTFRAAQEASA